VRSEDELTSASNSDADELPEIDNTTEDDDDDENVGERDGRSVVLSNSNWGIDTGAPIGEL
jgi:hypothetical protein